MLHRCGHAHALAQTHPFPFPDAREHYAADRPVRAESVALEVSLDFDKKELAGACTTSVRAVQKVEAVSFDAVDLDVERVEVDDRRARFSTFDGKLSVELASPLVPGAACSVRVTYRCRPTRGLYFNAPDEGYPDRPRQAWTQGQDEDSRCWFPCLDAPAQKAATELRVTVPASMTALSNGRLASDQVHGDLRTLHYVLERPHSPYLVTLAVGELEEVQAQAGQVPLRYLFPRGRRDDALRCLANTPRMVQLLEEATGTPYPWGGYAQVFVAEFIFGGMENTSATTLTDTVLHDERAHLDFSAESLVVHELAHQWFGDLLTCRDWPHGWLNEGFATWFEVLWKERAEGLDEGDHQRKLDLESYLDEAQGRYARPIVARRFAAPVDLFDRHFYEKGALVLHELRQRLGDDDFFASLRAYVRAHEGGNVETVDLARAVETTTGRNFDGFFDQYVFSPGHPELKAEVRYQEKERRVCLKVTQAAKVGEAWWRLPLEVVVREKGGDDVTHRLELSDAEHVFYLPVAAPPVQVRLDPRRHLLATLAVDKPSEWWRAELTDAPEARARTEAAAALGKEATRKAVQALAAALRAEKFWGTQAACARALAAIRSDEARDGLLDALSVKHPKARRAVVAGLGDFRHDPQVARALRARCDEGDESYFVEAEAARALGRTRADDAAPLLLQVAARPSFMDVVASGALEGLAELRRPQVWTTLVDATRYGRPPYARRAALHALARVAEVLDKKADAADVIAERLRDPSFRMQLAAIDAAVTLGDERLLTPLVQVPFSDARARRAAREAARTIRERSGTAKELAALREDVEKLKGEVRTLRHDQEPRPGGAKRKVKGGRAKKGRARR